jgi:DNA-binding transcriptional LysR family regulator
VPHGDIQTLLLASRKGISIMPDEPSCSPGAGSEVVAIPFDEPDAKVEVHVAWRRSERSPAVLAFLDSVRRVFHPSTVAAISPCVERGLDPRVSFRIAKPGPYQTS